MTRHPAPTRVHAAMLSLLAALALCAGAAVAAAPALATGDANTASCPNEAMEGFREYLADCRAYELVSPGFTDGGQVGGTVISADGSRVIEESRSGYAGVGGNNGEADYLLSRLASGWGVQALNPPDSAFPAQQYDGANPELTETLWTARRPSESVIAQNLYLREEDGTMVEVGPIAAPAYTTGPPGGEYQILSTVGAIHYRAASLDLSHILFSMNGNGPLWPGDTTQPHGNAETLYEYVGTGNSVPTLVGTSDGSTVVNGKVLAAGKLISDCGTAPGSTEGNDGYNAMSANGETVYFTAGGKSPSCELPAPEVRELYAKRNGTETVAISEPTAADCSVCNVPVTAAGGRKPAEFAGASEDGSKVFFTTEQELFPGATTNNLYEYDFDNAAGARIVRVSVGSAKPGVLGVARVSEDGSHVYFVAEGALTSKANGEGALPVEGADNLYVYVRDSEHAGGALSFIGTLSSEDSGDWEGIDDREAQATPDGRFFVFVSRAHLVAGDSSTTPQVFEYDATDDELVRVSQAGPGYAPGSANADAAEWGIAAQAYERGVSPYVADVRLAVSADGSTVAFTGVGALTAAAEGPTAEGRRSVYEFRSPGAAGRLSEGKVSFVSGSTFAASSPRESVAGLTASGGDLFFNTPEQLLAGDLNTQIGTYDAHSDGGFAPAVAPARCAGEACQGSQGPLPALGGAASLSTPGGGNLIAPAAPAVAAPAKPKTTPKVKRCKQGYVKRKGRCVKRPRAKKTHKGGK